MCRGRLVIGEAVVLLMVLFFCESKLHDLSVPSRRLGVFVNVKGTRADVQFQFCKQLNYNYYSSSVFARIFLYFHRMHPGKKMA